MPTHRLKKVLVANRGEIACRVMRACRESDIQVVAVFSEADRDSLHVRMADEAVCIGPPPAGESYLRSDRILEAAKRCNADAVHPGYGFLSENAAFARACADAGLIFIGPSPAAIEAMGGKTSARALMEQAGVPVVPGDNGPEGRGFASVEQARAAAACIGYPVMLKAAAGGGGRGMRLVTSDKELAQALEAARRESKNAFGDDAVYLEKAVVAARHVEIQIFGDHHGNLVHLYERDCSIQRRNQKVIEETPCPALSGRVRDQMTDVAVRAARAVGYAGAGTVEMLYDTASGAFYFLEMNTRLQVEHPITELVTGVDLVRWQLAVAQGEPLPLSQDEIPRTGAAIECRIYAEDPVRFLPSPGTINSFCLPSGPGVRNDAGVEAGSVISPYYDPMIAKLSVWGGDRAAAIQRMKCALDEYHVGGLTTNLPFHRQVMRHPAFLAGEVTTDFIKTHQAELVPPPPTQTQIEDAAIAAALATAEAEAAAQGKTRAGTPSPEISSWRRHDHGGFPERGGR
jgi:acetyl-CoA carboxylase biotin carboxylase subunit